MGTLPTSYSNPKGKNKMKLTFALAVEISSRQPRPESLSAPDGVCEDGEGWACSGEIVNVVMECIAGIGTGNPLGIYQCVMDAIGAGSDCADCVCWVMSFVGVEC